MGKKNKIYLALMASLNMMSECAVGNEGNALRLSQVNGQNGFKIKGFPDAQVGISISGAGDINNDGSPDLVVGTQIGKSYVIYGGQAINHPFDLSTLDG